MTNVNQAFANQVPDKWLEKLPPAKAEKESEPAKAKTDTGNGNGKPDKDNFKQWWNEKRVGEHTEGTEETEVTDYCVPSVSSVSGRWSDETNQRIKAALQESIVRELHTRNSKVKDLARRLKCIPELKDCDAEELETIIRKWYELSRQYMEEQAWEFHWEHWLYLWQWTTITADQDKVIIARDKSMLDTRPLPLVAQQYKSKHLRQLVSLCRVLAETAADDDGVFYLSSRKGAEVLGLADHNLIAKWLRQLVRDKILEKVGEHVEHSRRAQRFRYIGDRLPVAEQVA